MMTGIDSPSGRWVTFTINASGVVTSAQDNAGHTLSYGYDANWRLTSVTNANNETKTYEYTTDNRMFRARSAKGDMLVENTYATGTGAVTQQKLGDLTTFLLDRKSTRLNSSHQIISYAVFCLKKKKKKKNTR